MMSEHCVRHCTLMMVYGIVLGKAKTTKVGMVWYEFNIVNESMNELMKEVGIELLGQLKINNWKLLGPEFFICKACLFGVAFVYKYLE